MCAWSAYHPTMTQDEARRLIIQEMRERLASIPYRGADAGIGKFEALRRERPELFTFRSRADQWQVVHGWMLKAGLVTQ